MDFIEVKLGSRTVLRLVNTRIQTMILEKLSKYTSKLFVPFGKVFRYAKNQHDLEDVLKYEHLINYKINSPLVYLFLTTHNNRNYCFYIMQGSAGIDILSIVHRFDLELFKTEVVFEGYLTTSFLIEDVISCDPKVPLEGRIKIINDILDYKYRHDPVLDVYRIVLKDYVEYAYLRSFVAQAPPSTELIFSPLGKCVTHIIVDKHTKLPEYTETVQELKPMCEIIPQPVKTSACFMVKTTDKPDIYELHLQHHNIIKYYDIANVPNKKISIKLYDIFKDNTPKLMICEYDARDHIKRWIPIMISNRSLPDSWDLLNGPI